ncbi:MAG: hypothetical protein KJO55_01685 [Gammaproteobacteria bacterium]|nr:hypothetical protein [Gammaproteobacteria bacterium]
MTILILPALLFLIVSVLLARHGRPAISWLVFVVGLVSWLVGVDAVIETTLRKLHQYPARVALLSVSFLALSVAGRRCGWAAGVYSGLLLLPLLVWLAVRIELEPFRNLAWLAWLVALVSHLEILRGIPGARYLAAWHVGGVVLVVTLLVRELQWIIGVTTWTNTAIVIALVVLAISLAHGHRFLHWPLRRERRIYLATAVTLVCSLLVWFLVVVTVTSGDPMPLAYRPLLNPYDIATLILLVGALVVLHAGLMQWRPAFAIATIGLSAASLCGWLLVGFAVVHGVYYGGPLRYWNEMTNTAVFVMVMLVAAAASIVSTVVIVRKVGSRQSLS